MRIISYIMLAFSILGAIDYMLHNKFGLGKEWERGFSLLGTMSLTMIGMLVLAPFISHILSPVLMAIANNTPFDPSVIPGMLLANDMGAATLAKSLGKTSEMGYFNGLVVSAMMGVTISFTLPLAMGIVEKRQQKLLLSGLLCGVIAIPVGCFAGGLVAGISVLEILIDLIPLTIMAVVLAIGLLRIPEFCVKVFRILGILVRIIITIGLMIGVAEFVTGHDILPYTATMEEGIQIVFNAVIVMSGAFPLLFIVGKILRKPLQVVGKKCKINEHAALGFVSSLATSVTTFSMLKDMDDKGAMLNCAFAVSGAFTFASHLAFTMSFHAAFLPSVIVGKLVGGLTAVIIAWFLYPKIYKESFI